MTLPRLRIALVGTVAASLLLLVAGASAAGAFTHPKLISPKRATVFAPASKPTFKVSDKSRNAKTYGVFISIANKKSIIKKGDDGGDLKYTTPGTFSKMKRRGTTFTWVPTADDTLEGGFMATPGKYYWQAFHTDCSQKSGRCHIHSQVGSFVVQ